jgi:hypothetical protein
MKNEPNLYTPDWEPLGKSKKHVLENPEVYTINLPLGKNESVVDTTLNTVQEVVNNAQEVVDSIKNPLNLLKLIK